MLADFDTGQRKAYNPWADAVRDWLPADHTEEDFHHAAARQMAQDMWKAKKPETVLKHYRMNTALLAEMAEQTPQAFFLAISELHDRLSVDVPLSPAKPAEIRAVPVRTAQAPQGNAPAF